VNSEWACKCDRPVDQVEVVSICRLCMYVCVLRALQHSLQCKHYARLNSCVMAGTPVECALDKHCTATHSLQAVAGHEDTCMVGKAVETALQSVYYKNAC
jgi:hypothetical protein